MLALVPQAALVAGEDGLTPQSVTQTAARPEPVVTDRSLPTPRSSLSVLDVHTRSSTDML